MSENDYTLSQENIYQRVHLGMYFSQRPDFPAYLNQRIVFANIFGDTLFKKVFVQFLQRNLL